MQTRFRTSGIRGLLSPSTSWPTQSRTAYHFGPSLFFWSSWSLKMFMNKFTYSSRPLVAKCQTNKRWVQNGVPPPEVPAILWKREWSKPVSFHWVHPGDRIWCAVPLYLTLIPPIQQQGTLTPEMPSRLLLLTSGLLMQSQTSLSFPRSWAAAYQPLFRGDELLLIVLFKWAKQIRRNCVRVWHWLRCVVVIYHHVSVISY